MTTSTQDVNRQGLILGRPLRSLIFVGNIPALWIVKEVPEHDAAENSNRRKHGGKPFEERRASKVDDPLAVGQSDKEVNRYF